MHVFPPHVVANRGLLKLDATQRSNRASDAVRVNLQELAQWGPEREKTTMQPSYAWAVSRHFESRGARRRHASEAAP